MTPPCDTWRKRSDRVVDRDGLLWAEGPRRPRSVGAMNTGKVSGRVGHSGRASLVTLSQIFERHVLKHASLLCPAERTGLALTPYLKKKFLEGSVLVAIIQIAAD
jgi:hypothetical protein